VTHIVSRHEIVPQDNWIKLADWYWQHRVQMPPHLDDSLHKLVAVPHSVHVAIAHHSVEEARQPQLPAAGPLVLNSVHLHCGDLVLGDHMHRIL
jgi:hypothetical protein